MGGDQVRIRVDIPDFQPKSMASAGIFEENERVLAEMASCPGVEDEMER